MEKTNGTSGTNGIKGINRAQFLAGAAAVGLAGALLPTGRAEASGGGEEVGGEGVGGEGGGGRGLTRRGVVYTLVEGETPATAFSLARMREDIRVIRDDLHADTVDVTGDGVERLTATAAEVAERGMHVWLQPTLTDRPQKETLEHLAECGRFAERLRRQGASVEFSVGCEFWLLVPGIVPGADVMERIRNLLSGTVDWEQMQRRLDRFTAEAARVGRSVFRGRLSYAAAQDDRVDWNLFDVVGIDYYSYHRDRREYVKELKSYLRWGKPVAITEFGTCTYVGAPEAGGMGWDIVDYDKNPPEIKGNPVRSERVQAAYVTDLLDVFESMNLYAAMAFEFLTADAPHHPHDPLHDLDLAGYGITKAVRDRPDDPDSPWRREPKEAFHALARRYARACRAGRKP
ncbi:abortive phage infection protein [Streptomyces lincolnensis]|uniref:abortive phage infection protein n=1 Tax=Streptomyces lincolnensis TaxID=1915 RepID=UPI001E5295AE|nr:abortive phage infection protein [Streptomyces lincolnensis]MCD7439793.1 abortive phage infection protein [Streptomyces lincolnensis]